MKQPLLLGVLHIPNVTHLNHHVTKPVTFGKFSEKYSSLEDIGRHTILVSFDFIHFLYIIRCLRLDVTLQRFKMWFPRGCS